MYKHTTKTAVQMSGSTLMCAQVSTFAACAALQALSSAFWKGRLASKPPPHIGLELSLQPHLVAALVYPQVGPDPGVCLLQSLHGRQQPCCMMEVTLSRCKRHVMWRWVLVTLWWTYAGVISSSQ